MSASRYRAVHFAFPLSPEQERTVIEEPADVFAPCRCVVMKLRADENGAPIPTAEMIAVLEDRVLHASDVMAEVLAAAPRLKAERTDLLVDALAWLDKLAVHDRAAVTDRARKQEAMAGEAARIIRLALGEVV